MNNIFDEFYNMVMFQEQAPPTPQQIGQAADKAFSGIQQGAEAMADQLGKQAEAINQQITTLTAKLAEIQKQIDAAAVQNTPAPSPVQVSSSTPPPAQVGAGASLGTGVPSI